MIDVQFRKIGIANLNTPILIEGFPGLGLVGTLATGYLIKKFNMELVGYIYSNKFPAVSAVHESVPLPPVRIYASEKHDLLVLISEFVIPSAVVPYVGEGLIEYAKRKNVKLVLSLGSIALDTNYEKLEEKKNDKNENPEEVIYAIANSQKHRILLSKLQRIKLIKEGATSGVSAYLLVEGTYANLPVMSLLAPTSSRTLDIVATIRILDAVSRITGLNIDLEELKEDAIKVEQTIKTIIKNAKKAHLEYKKVDQQNNFRSDSLDNMYG
ncbi:MAG: PAC2 family protein [Candidatus Anstonellales archaeon]